MTATASDPKLFRTKKGPFKVGNGSYRSEKQSMPWTFYRSILKQIMKFLTHGNFEQAQQCFFRPTKAFSQFNHSLYKYSLQLLHTQVDALLLGIDCIIHSNFPRDINLSQQCCGRRFKRETRWTMAPLSLSSTKEATKKGKGPPLSTVTILLCRECTA